MMIPYLLSISILILSVLKMADTMIYLDKKHNKVKDEFIEQTKSLHKNQKGNISLSGAALAMILSGFLLFLSQKHFIELKESKYRKESYLCMAYLNRETKDYVSSMSKFNLLLRTLHISLMSGLYTAQVKIVIEATKIARQKKHMQYLKNINWNAYCKSELMSLSYLQKLPYKTNNLIALKTNPDATTQLEANEWTIILFKKPNGIRIKNAFCLKTEFKLESNFSSSLEIKTSEIQMMDLSALNCLSGPLSSS